MKILLTIILCLGLISCAKKKLTEAEIASSTTIDSDGDGIVNALDCEPNDPNKWRTGWFYQDSDGDGYVNHATDIIKLCYGRSQSWPDPINLGPIIDFGFTGSQLQIALNLLSFQIGDIIQNFRTDDYGKLSSNFNFVGAIKTYNINQTLDNPEGVPFNFPANDDKNYYFLNETEPKIENIEFDCGNVGFGGISIASGYDYCSNTSVGCPSLGYVLKKIPQTFWPDQNVPAYICSNNSTIAVDTWTHPSYISSMQEYKATWPVKRGSVVHSNYKHLVNVDTTFDYVMCPNCYFPEGTEEVK